jgi:hypothetical protein
MCFLFTHYNIYRQKSNPNSTIIYRFLKFSLARYLHKKRHKPLLYRDLRRAGGRKIAVTPYGETAYVAKMRGRGRVH